MKAHTRWSTPTMSRIPRVIWQLLPVVTILFSLVFDAGRFLRLCLRSRAALAAENLFLRQQLAMYQARNIKPRQVTNATRFTLVWLSHWLEWQRSLSVVKPETFTRWRRQGFAWLWRRQSHAGRPPIPDALQALIRQMARENLTWGQQRIANELRLKLGLRVSPRTVRKYTPTRLHRGPGHRAASQRWGTFLRNQAWDLIVHSGTAAVIRGVQAVSARLRWSLQRWWGRFVASGLQDTAPSDTVSFALLIKPLAVSPAWSPDSMDVSSAGERSPPDMGRLHHQVPCTTARAIPVDTLGVPPVVAAVRWWNGASAHVWDAEHLSKDGSRVIPWRRAA
jgi:hypothetical protein